MVACRWDGRKDEAEELREQILDPYCDCLVVRNEFDGAAYSKDPLSIEAQVAGHADRAFEDAVLALWLARRTALSFARVVHAEFSDGLWTPRLVYGQRPFAWRPNYDVEHTVEDFGLARRLAARLQTPGPVAAAARALGMALQQDGFEMRFLALWLAMEALFGAADGREIRYRLSQRAALFLEGRNVAGKALFQQLKSSYDARSKVVHGLRKDFGPGEQDSLIEGLEETLRRALGKVLLDDGLREKMTATKAREDFLDELVFD